MKFSLANISSLLSALDPIILSFKWNHLRKSGVFLILGHFVFTFPLVQMESIYNGGSHLI